ncbi:hypothetical protein [Nonomuraea phyllanthi]|uniref:hypothetical protein n=1 Tax=Nonomuraea phyllanthi TaxID=2219224 RepID=UPI001D136CFA|nr:hypothetical protein [Nonomuraea phyllanthi]
MLEQLDGPSAWAAGEFEHAAGRPERIERRRQLRGSGKEQSVALIFFGNRPVVDDLFVE